MPFRWYYKSLLVVQTNRQGRNGIAVLRLRVVVHDDLRVCIASTATSFFARAGQEKSKSKSALHSPVAQWPVMTEHFQGRRL